MIPLAKSDAHIARVIGEHKGAYRVKNEHGEFLARVTGRHMFHAKKREEYPAVGDWVEIEEHADGRATILGILPRKTVLKKKHSHRQDIQIIATNIDEAFIIESLDRDYNLNRFERYLVLANEGGITPVIVLNKTDLVPADNLAEKIKEIQDRFGDIEVVLTSTKTDRGLDTLLAHIEKNRTYCFLGSSGVGKSSLINKLLGENIIKTGETSATLDRGRHTTTAREMYFLENGGIVIDNPGTREVGIAEAKTGLANVFGEITRLAKKCRYADCTHTKEPDCAVIKAARDGKLDEAKYENYLKLKKENEFYEATDFERRKKDRTFGKFVKKALKEVKKDKS